LKSKSEEERKKKKKKYKIQYILRAAQKLQRLKCLCESQSFDARQRCTHCQKSAEKPRRKLKR
jgi:hypothetical protein